MPKDINLITRDIENKFDEIETQIVNGELFAPWRGSFEVKKVYIKKEDEDIKCDLDVRLKHWPEGVVIKVYKHKALAVLPYIKDADVAREHLNTDPMPAKFWKDAFYFSHRSDLDDGRYVLREGNKMTDADAATCLAMLKGFIVEVNEILKR